MNALDIFLLFFSIFVLLTSCWFLFFPDSAQTTIAWWVVMPKGLCYTAGVVQAALGLAVFVEAVRQVEDVVIVASVVIGLALIGAGALYFTRNGLKTLGDVFTKPHSALRLRALGTVGIIVVIVLLILAFNGS